MIPRHRIAALVAAALWALALAACSASPPPTPGSTATGTASSGSTRLPACKLPAPLKSEDACSADADCGVSEPCHAKACVAKAKSHPRTPEIMCTMNLECHSADANRCGCHEGRCALIPPS